MCLCHAWAVICLHNHVECQVGCTALNLQLYVWVSPASISCKPALALSSQHFWTDHWWLAFQSHLSKKLCLWVTHWVRVCYSSWALVSASPAAAVALEHAGCGHGVCIHRVEHKGDSTQRSLSPEHRWVWAQSIQSKSWAHWAWAQLGYSIEAFGCSSWRRPCTTTAGRDAYSCTTTSGWAAYISFQYWNLYFIQKRHPYTGILHSEKPGYCRNAFLHWGDVLAVLQHVHLGELPTAVLQRLGEMPTELPIHLSDVSCLHHLPTFSLQRVLDYLVLITWSTTTCQQRLTCWCWVMWSTGQVHWNFQVCYGFNFREHAQVKVCRTWHWTIGLLLTS